MVVRFYDGLTDRMVKYVVNLRMALITIHPLGYIRHKVTINLLIDLQVPFCNTL